jgi:hypothetical protein
MREELKGQTHERIDDAHGQNSPRNKKFFEAPQRANGKTAQFIADNR